MRLGSSAVDQGWVRPTGLLLGAAADGLLGDPRLGHPVAGFGVGAAALERRPYADHRGAGLAHTALLVAAAGGLGVAVERTGRRHPLIGVLGTALATWAVLGGASLAGHGAALARELNAGDLDAARRRMPSLCGRDPALLDAAAWPGPAPSPWPRTPRTRWSPRCSGEPSPAFPVCSATGR